MRKKKRFQERWDAVAPGMLESEPATRKDDWKRGYATLWVELGCGKGLYLTRRAAAQPDGYFVGIEKNQSVLLLAMERAAREDLRNIAYVYGNADDLEDWFSDGELDRLDIMFCDPWPEQKRAKRRLTNGRYLQIYKTLLGSNGLLCLRTDSGSLYNYSLSELDKCGFTVISQTRNLHAEPDGDGMMTGYEERFAALGQPIYQVLCTPAKPV